MVGWYHTGPQLRSSDQEINDVFKRYIPQPVMVIVDTRQSTVGIPTEAYFAVEEIRDVRVLTIVPCLVLRPISRMGPSRNVLFFMFPQL